jgi:hypothetical protein
LWTGLAVAGVGVLLAVAGWGHQTRVETAAGGLAWERELVRAFSRGGLKYTDLQAPPAPGPNQDAAAVERAFEQWERQRAAGKGRRWDVRVDTTATTPCPT